MNLTYELWDIETRNIVAAFASEDAALASVRATLETQGPAAVQALVLLTADDDGDGEHIAAGDALIARAEALPLLR